MNKSKRKEEGKRGRLPLLPTRPVVHTAVTATDATTRTATFNADAQKGGGRRNRVATHAVTPAAAACHQRIGRKGKRSRRTTGARRMLPHHRRGSSNEEANAGRSGRREEGGERFEALKQRGNDQFFLLDS